MEIGRVKTMKRNISKIAIHSLVASMILLGISVDTAFAANDKQSVEGVLNGVVASVNGEAFVIRAGKTIPLVSGMEILEKDVVKASNGTVVQVVFPDKTQATIANGSSVEITIYKYSQSEAKINLTVLHGAIETKAGDIATKNPENFSVKTENSIITAKTAGVTLQAQVTGAGDKVVSQSGDISVQPIKGASSSVDVKAGQITIVTDSKVVEVPKAISSENTASMSVVFNSTNKDAQPAIRQIETTLPTATKTETTVLPTFVKQEVEVSVLPTLQENKVATPQIPEVKVETNIAPSITTVDAFKANASVSNTGILKVNDPNGDKLTYSITKLPTNGAASIDQDGAYSYKANSGFYGTDSFEVTVDDSKAGGKVTTVIRAYNDRPVASTLGTTIVQNMKTATLNVSATDANNDSLVYAIVSQPSHGQITFNPDGTYSYAPNYNYSGSDSFSYKANDGLADSEIKSVTITVVANSNHPSADPTNQSASSLTPPLLGETATGSYSVAVASLNSDVEWGVWSNSDRPFVQLSLQNDITGYWVKGTLTPNSVIENYIRNDQVYTYSGTNSILGHFLEGADKSAITSSSANLTINFGAVNPISGNINFAGSSQSVALSVSGGSVIPNVVSITTPAVTNTTGQNAGNVSVNNFSLSGSFYGASANSIGATFNGSGVKSSSNVSFQGALTIKK